MNMRTKKTDRSEKLAPYIDEVIETQGKLFDFVALTHPEADMEDFINAYMRSNTCKCIDQASGYVCTLDDQDLFEFFKKTDHYKLKPGKAIQGFIPAWMGEFYSLYQFQSSLSSAEVIEEIPVKSLVRAYSGLHDLDLDLAVCKILNALNTG